MNIDTIDRTFSPICSVSVIIAVYNGEAYIREAIESAKNQTVPPSEIIVVDDGSSDRTAEIVASIPDVKLFRQKNAGQAAARNHGLAMSSGDAILFLDHDDRMLPDNIEKALDALARREDCAFTAGRSVIIDHKGERPLDENNRDIIMGDGKPSNYLTLLAGNAFVPPSVILFRREGLEIIGNFNEKMRSGCEDLDLYLRMAKEFPIDARADVVTEYRRHDSNDSSNSRALLISSIELLNAHIEKNSEAHKASAIRAGIRNWARVYGPGLVGQAAGNLRRGKFKLAFSGIALAIRYYPRGVFQYIFHRTRRALKR